MYTLPSATGKGRKRKLTGHGNVVDASKPKKVMSTPVQNGKPAQKRSSSAHNMLPKKKQCRPVDKPSDCMQLRTNASSTGRHQTEWTMFRYHAVDAVWQRQKCNLLGLQYCCANRFASGSADSTLTLPSVIRDTLPDGNCLFRAFALMITGTQVEHFAVRNTILKHMREIERFLLGCLITSHDNVEAYIQSTSMDQDGTWAQTWRSSQCHICCRLTCTHSIRLLHVGCCIAPASLRDN